MSNTLTSTIQLPHNGADAPGNGYPCLGDCSAIILAGGRSTRFGSEKASAEWRGLDLLSHVVLRLCGALPEIIAVARAEQATAKWPVNRVVLDDPRHPSGPLRGIFAGLTACTYKRAFILSCDAPCVEPALLAALRERLTPDIQAVAPEWEGHLQPLVSLFARESLPLLAELLKQGERSPRRAFRLLPHSILPMRDCQAADPRGLSFHNINSREDLFALEHSLGGCES